MAIRAGFATTATLRVPATFTPIRTSSFFVGAKPGSTNTPITSSVSRSQVLRTDAHEKVALDSLRSLDRLRSGGQFDRLPPFRLLSTLPDALIYGLHLPASAG